MVALVKVEDEDVKPVLPLTPSPSPPSRDGLSLPALAVPSTETIVHQQAEEALRAKHVAHARLIADRVRLLHLSKAMYTPRPASSSLTQAVKETTSGLGRLTRYQVEVERLEGDATVTRRVTVLIPPPLAGPKERAAPYAVPGSRLPAAGLTFLPPPAFSRSARRPSLPSLASLSLEAPPRPPRLFQHANPGSSASSSSSASSASSPAKSDSQAYQQRRRPALSFRHCATSSSGTTLTKHRISRERERLPSLSEEETESEAGAVRRREGQLMERRGRVVEPLVLV